MKVRLATVIACGFAVIFTVPSNAEPLHSNLRSIVHVGEVEAIRLNYHLYVPYFTWGQGGAQNVMPDGVCIGPICQEQPFLTSDGLVVSGPLLAMERAGIGTLTPQSELHVQGDGSIADVWIAPNDPNETSRLTMCQDPDCDDASVLRYDGGNNSFFLYFKDAGGNGYNRDRISLKVEHHANSSARVGINVPRNHDIKKELEVNGTILAEEILVESSVADYVFDDNFDLMSLEQVSAYIENYRHLPGIPSKFDVAKQGGTVPLGQAFTQMLQKIEELTLYTIEQHNTLNAQEKFLTAQREEMRAMQAEITELRQMLSSKVH